MARKKHGDYAGVVDIARNGIDRVNMLEKELRAANKGAERNLRIARNLTEENMKLRSAARELLRIAGPELWQNSEYFRAAGRLATLLNLKPNTDYAAPPNSAAHMNRFTKLHKNNDLR